MIIRMRLALVSLLLLCCAAGILSLLWHEEYRYSLPTPKPTDFVAVPVGSTISRAGLVDFSDSSRIVFAHFFSPECPCSRFNLRHFNSIVRTYGRDVSFLVIIPEWSSADRARELIGEELPLVVDTEGRLAERCGVYATPQAVIIKPGGTLYYRGNYNQSRFCTIPASNYADLSLAAALADQPLPEWGAFATTPYGCQIPDSSQKSLTFVDLIFQSSTP